jgi:polyisoprenyl-phosphate glycosyltransferase
MRQQQSFCFNLWTASQMHSAAARNNVLSFGERPTPRRTLSIVIPFFNEAPNAEALLTALDAFVREAEAAWPLKIDVVLVDDGSTDGGAARLEAAVIGMPRAMDVRVLRLSRNFGKEIALTAGLTAVDTDAVVMMDADLQHPPHVIHSFLAGWLDEGFDVVHAIPDQRRRQPWLKKAARKAFYQAVNIDSSVPLVPDATDFRLMSRRAYQALNQLGERQRLMKGLYSWVGFRQKCISFAVPDRLAGTTKYSRRKIWALGVNGLTAFSVAPLRMATLAGALLALLSVGYALWTAFTTLILGATTRGYPTIVCAILLTGATQMLLTGVVGEYIGQVLIEVKQRPLFILESEKRFSTKIATRDASGAL